MPPALEGRREDECDHPYRHGTNEESTQSMNRMGTEDAFPQSEETQLGQAEGDDLDDLKGELIFSCCDFSLSCRFGVVCDDVAGCSC